MIPELSSGAAASAAAWPSAAAGAPDPAAQSNAAPSDPFADLFADLLAATMAPQAANADNAGSNAESNPVALPISLTDLWLGLAMPVYSEDETSGATEELSAVAGEGNEDEALEASSSVPADAADAAAVPVPIIVQVPTGIMSAAPVEASREAAAEPGALGVAPRQDQAAGRETASGAGSVPVPQPQSVAAGVTPRNTNAAGGKSTADGGGVESDLPAAIERTLTPMERMESSAPAQLPQQPVGRGFAARQAGEGSASDRPVGTTPVNGDARAASIDVPASPSTDKAAVAPVSAVADLPEGEATVAGGNEVSRSAGRESAPGPVTSAAQAKAQPAQAGREHQSQASVAPATTPVPLEQAAQAALGRGLVPRQDNAGAEDTAATERAAATAAVQGVPSAFASQQQGGDASQNGAGNQPSPDQAPRDMAAAGRAADAPAFSTPLGVTSAEPASRPVLQAAPLPAPFTPAQETENAGRLIESMRVQYRQGVPEATVRLNPEHLGEVTISIRVDKGVVSATVTAESPAVQQWLESQAEKLRSGLADQGMSLDRFVVQRERQQQERREQRPQHQQARYRQPQEPGQRFEVTV